MRTIFALGLLVCVLIIMSASVLAATSFSGVQTGSARFVQYQQSPDLQRYYGSQQQEYWPILGNTNETCRARQDLLIQVAPIGCQPAVVRSDLLAEQNVPVFCQIDALRLNPLLDIKQIRSIGFSSRSYPKEVSGVSFHPARAALRTNSQLLGDPFLNNIGYAVVLLKRAPNEIGLPDFVNFTVQARIEYNANNAFGVGESVMLLEPVSDDEWLGERNKNSFLKGKYFVRLESVDAEQAVVSFYKGDRRVNRVSVRRGEKSNSGLYIPGSYCQGEVRVVYEGAELPKPSVRLQVDDDVLSLYEGASFLNNKCRVNKLRATNSSGGEVEISCGSDRFVLRIAPRELQQGDSVYRFVDGAVKKEDGAWIIDSVKKDKSGEINYTLKQETKEDITVNAISVRPASDGVLYEAEYSGELKTAYDNAIAEYQRVAELYPDEKSTKSELEGVSKYGEYALSRAISLAEMIGKERSVVELMNRYLTIYPDGERADEYTLALNNYYQYDLRNAVTVVDVDGATPSTLRLLGVEQPRQTSRADFFFAGRLISDVPLGANISLADKKSMTLDKIEKESADVTVYCSEERGKRSVSLRLDDTQSLCGGVLKLEDVESASVARIRLLPGSVRGAGIETNVTIGVGIEKRAFKLTPEKTNERLEELNKTIKRWDQLSTNLGNVVKGMKAACFATAGVLTVKNFVTGLSGEALARKNVMQGPNGWTEWCGKAVNGQIAGVSYESVGECYSAKSVDIQRDVEGMTRRIAAQNKKIKDIESSSDISSSDGLFGERVDGTAAAARYADGFDASTKNTQITLANGQTKTVGALTSEQNGKRYATYEEAKEMQLYASVLNDASSSDVAKDAARERLKHVGGLVNERVNVQGSRDSWSQSAGTQVEIFTSKDSVNAHYYGQTLGQKDYGLTIDGTNLKSDTPVQVVGVERDGVLTPYLAVLHDSGDGNYGAKGYYELTKDGSLTAVTPASLITSLSNSRIGTFSKLDQTTCFNKINNPKIQYYESEPYKGMPAVVPFDIEQGWYAGTRQTLAGFGNVKAFQSSGRPTSFWVCNVGGDHEIDFFVSGFDDDECQQFNVETGAPLDSFACLDERGTKRLVDRAVRALQDAAQQRKDGSRFARIEGQTIEIGNPAMNLPGTQCQDFMSPSDCKLLFNVCDPVICPASRCNLGGTYNVPDVIQSGIAGSALLCLPNIREGIAVPVCLTGIKAGIDGYLSILKSYQSCLQESLVSGQYVGICDEVTAVYMCEFFWRQAAPVANVLLPKLIEFAYGQGQARGGGEYLTTQSAWDNAQASVNYFTQSYAVNSLQAFNIRSVEEAGTPFCRAFVSATAPSKIDALIEPDSPPQFHAWFSTIPYSDATVPATAQYKVFYHIFAGNDRGVSYSVYLKDPPATSYYQTTPIVSVASNFVPRGQAASETRDFTAPTGYQQLCVRIDDKEECGFKQVSTSFAVDYVRDQFASDEINQRDITSEKECVSGRASPLALLNPNVQEAAQEAIDPAVYNRGVTRICATANPGRNSDPSRFLDVGSCGESRVRCWLDVQSVDRAISVENVGVRNATLSEFQSDVRVQLGNQIEYLYGEGENELIEALTQEVTKFEGDSSLNAQARIQQSRILAEKSDKLNDQVLLPNLKAHLIVLRGRVYEAVAKALHLPLKEKSNGQITSADNVAGAVVAPTGVVRLEKEYTPRERISFVVNNIILTNLYVEGSNIKSGSGLTLTRIGVVGADGIITLLPGAANDANLIKLSRENNIDLYHTLNGARLQDGNVELVFDNGVVNLCRIEFSQGDTIKTSGTFGLEDLEIVFKGCEKHLNKAEVAVMFSPRDISGQSVRLDTFMYDATSCNYRVSLTRITNNVFPGIGTLRAVLQNVDGAIAEGSFEIVGTQKGVTPAGILISSDSCQQ